MYRELNLTLVFFKPRTKVQKKKKKKEEKKKKRKTAAHKSIELNTSLSVSEFFFFSEGI